MESTRIPQNSQITTKFSGVHLESTWSSLESIWTPHMNLTKSLDKCHKLVMYTIIHFFLCTLEGKGDVEGKGMLKERGCREERRGIGKGV